jgi:isopenicillin N synthase-like dioxygenase
MPDFFAAARVLLPALATNTVGGVTVPVIDLSGDPRRVAAEIGTACRDLGFLTVTGHGVPDAVLERTAGVARTFFDLPDAEKRTLAEGEPQLGLPAYRPLRSESLAASLGQKTPGDLKESLDWGPAVAGHGWPARPPELRAAFEDYFEAVSGLGGRLRRLFALALDLPEDWFEPAFEGHSSSMRVINYPPPDEEIEHGQLRAGAHTDYGCMTILRTEDAPGGLQVQARDGGWLDLRALPGSFVVNLGDMMARWTNDSWAATLHRVAVPPADRAARSRRQTIVFFHDPRSDAVIECIPGCADNDHPPRYEPVTALEYVQSKAARALA